MAAVTTATVELSFDCTVAHQSPIAYSASAISWSSEARVLTLLFSSSREAI
jgi:hypothetical protein